MSLKRSPDGSLSATDALLLHHYRSKHQWEEFNDDLVDTTTEGIDQVERSEAWTRVRTTFRRIEPIDQRALQKVVIEGLSLRQAALQLGISAMTVQRRVKRGLNRLARELKEDQAGV